MQGREKTTVIRDIEAIQIPDGITVVITQGTAVWITQQLGNSFTVMTDRGAMFRVDEKNADALGIEVRAADHQTLTTGSLEDRVWAQMKKCFDPEIPVNIVDLGLIYDCRVDDLDSGSSAVKIKMTLTAPGCGMGPILAEDVKARIEDLPDVDSADVEIVFDPPWTMDMMTEAAKLQLGFM
jgi:probable FeS assembly SUF system protein SufT